MNRYAVIFKLLKQIGMDSDRDYRQELALSVSEGRTNSLKELSDAELRELFQHLRTLAARVPPEYEDMQAERMRKKLFAIFRDIGWYHPSGKPNYEKINGWLYKFGYLKKPLNDYKKTELPRLISQVEQIQKQDYEKNKTKA